ncbi:Hypothetical protein, putative [Bodo saltans]|uniref:Uncharacterized protein n=1 Tax=Bodo saltans TaxID=75058 RepID=A0A0S4JPG0_BODSA|nr:Hypothetical protein, putative [Bodo saltans]|eukprot:CUG91169.1 Hypothetical protein, putative [Bodo saltans]
MSRTFLKFGGCGVDHGSGLHSISRHDNVSAAAPSSHHNAVPLLYTVSPSHQHNNNNNNNNNEQQTRPASNQTVDATFMRSLYTPLIADCVGMTTMVSSSPTTSAAAATALALLSDDALTDYEFLAAYDKSGSSVIDVTRIQMVEKTLLGPRDGAFGKTSK